MSKSNKIKNAAASAAKQVPLVKDFINKVWVMTVLATLWSSAYVIYMVSAGAPRPLRLVLTAALSVLGLMWLFSNLRSSMNTSTEA